MKTIFLILLFALSLLIPINVVHATIDSIIIESPDYSIQTVFKVTSYDDCYGDTKMEVKVILNGLMENVF